MPRLVHTADEVTVHASTYSWHYSPATDRVTLTDAEGRTVITAPAQPIIQADSPAGPLPVRCGLEAVVPQPSGEQVELHYRQLDGAATIRMCWRFDDAAIWLDPLDYEDPAGILVVDVHYFSTVSDGVVRPGIQSSHLIQPGLCQSPTIGPVVDSWARVEFVTHIGRGAVGDKRTLLAQWALPAHFFLAQHSDASPFANSSMTSLISDAVCCGLADLPEGDLKLVHWRKCYAPMVEIRDDLWGRAPTTHAQLGATWVWTLGHSFRDAQVSYYTALLTAGIVSVKPSDPARDAIASGPTFHVWGSQCGLPALFGDLRESHLRRIRDDMTAMGGDIVAFEIDDRWETSYGSLRHDPERFPDFDGFLTELRDQGLKYGLWSATVRCQDPGEVGLTPDHMLKDADGRPIQIEKDGDRYYFYDVTLPHVHAHLTAMLQEFARRYDPDLFKFDFGYELPDLATACPADRTQRGERLLRVFADLIASALRSVRPDISIMYYSLSPLFADVFDFVSLDDLFLSNGEYHVEANRRIYFSSAMGVLGVPTGGYGGYEWSHLPQVWFDSLAAGGIGLHGSFYGDPWDSTCSEDIVAKLNGCARLLRPRHHFSVTPLHASRLGVHSAALSSSWARHEDGALVVLAIRPWHFDARPGIREIDGIVSTDIQVAIASAGDEDISVTSVLRMVPYGEGTVTLHRAETEAVVTVHYLHGEPCRQTVVATEGRLAIPMREQDPTGRKVTWIEVALG